MALRSNRKIGNRAAILPVSILLVILVVSTRIGGTLAFITTSQTSINKNHNTILIGNLHDKACQERPSWKLNANPNHLHDLPSSYPAGTPPGLRGEAVRSALITTERCIGWNLATNPQTSTGGLLQISGRGVLDFLGGKLTGDFRSSSSNSNYKEACLLDAKGRLVDIVKVAMLDNQKQQRALVMTSPGHTSADLLQRLDPFVFPMDEVELTNFGHDDDTSFSFTLASTQYKHVQQVMLEQSKLQVQEMVFPGTSQSAVWKLGDAEILVIPATGLPSVACVGYTFVFFGSKDAAALGKQVWERLIGENNPEGPIEVGALEYETLRVEAGQPAYGLEYGIDRAKQQEQEQEEIATTATTSDQNSLKKKKPPTIKTSPLELHLNSLVDLDKGCYLGQEGIASILKNPRGAPRTLYSVVFEDEFNTYESGMDEDDFENLTTLPQPGQKLFALGSNEELQVGTITSMGEAGGTGSRFTVGLALIKRADSIRKKLQALDLEIPRDPDDFVSVDAATGSGIIQPPPLDPLQGLEVIVEGTFTVGKLQGVPSRQSFGNSNMFDPSIQVEGVEDYYEPSFSSNAGVATEPVETESPIVDEEDDSMLTDDLEEMEAEVAKATAEAEAAAAEAQRKAEKMELLKKRAEEAMARRKAAKAAAANKPEETEAKKEEDDAVAAEAKRKAEKMAMLKKRADEAMARRRAKKEQQES